MENIGNYRIKSLIGMGGLGVVFEASHLALDRTVAIKIINSDILREKAAIDSFHREARIQAQLNHPNIVEVYDLFEDCGKSCIVMEYVKGEDIGKIISRQGVTEPSIAVAIIMQVLEGLKYAHSHGVIHKDIKPSNILLTPLLAKITDFGTAQILNHTFKSSNGIALGTPKYMSPEQTLGEQTDLRSDIYSVGITLYEMLTGDIPFHIESHEDYEIRKAHIRYNPRPPSELIPNISKELEEIVLKAISKNPEDRFQTTDEFIDVLENLYIKNENQEINFYSSKNQDNKSLELQLTTDSNVYGLHEIKFDETGNLSANPYANVLLTVYNERRTGFLVIDSEDKLKIYFREGLIEFAECTVNRLMLGKILLNRSKISLDDQQMALGFSYETGLKIGEALIKLGKITSYELSETLKMQLKERLMWGFNFKKGCYSFKSCTNNNVDLDYKINPIHLIYEEVKRFIEPNDRTYENLFYKDTTLIPHYSIKEIADDLLVLTQKEKIVVELIKNKVSFKNKLTFINEEITPQKLMSESILSEKETFRLIYFLSLIGLLEVRGPERLKQN